MTDITTKPSSAFADTKPHFQLLDALRGVAAFMVIIYHVFEGYATSPFDQRFNHGYLAVDFFFMLSGFVVAYAYDDRWAKGMSTWDFLKRRLIRLHPLIVLGVVFGAITSLIQGSVQWDGTSIPMSMVFLALVMNIFLIPAAPGSGYEVRGNGELFPLNGPMWSLFFEYIGNILYALFIRRLSLNALRILVGLSGIGLAYFAIGNLSGFGHLGVGWTMAGNNFIGGFIKLLFCFSMGLLLSRTFKPLKIKHPFATSALILVALLCVPHLGGEANPWMNGIFDAVCVIGVFPLLVLIGASGQSTSAKASKSYQLLGDLSYPLYAIHYPFMYLFYAWLWNNGYSFAETWYVGIFMVVGNIALAYECMKFYDEPIRKKLSKRFLRQQR